MATPFDLNWPWSWLTGNKQPGGYRVPSSVQPVLEISKQWPPRLLADQDSTNLGAGNNTVPVTSPGPGFSRLITHLTFLCTVNTLEIELQYVMQGQTLVLFRYEAASYEANKQVPVVRGGWWQIGTAERTQVHAYPDPIYVPYPHSLQLLVKAAAGTETITTRKSFIQTDLDQPNEFPAP